MATVEPWLTNLLNKSRTPDLPPRQPDAAATSAPLPPTQSRSLPPLAPDLVAGHRPADRFAPPPIAALCTADDAHLVKPLARPDDAFGLHTASIRPLQLLLREPEPALQPIPLRNIVDDALPGSLDDASNKKRHRALATKEDLVQLPKLPKKQKSAQQVVPPIIAGLHEPPPDPAVFPPITSASFGENESFHLGAWKDLSGAHEERLIAPPVVDAEPTNHPPKPKRRPMKPRRKWTEEETNNLLLGVSRHGVGRWTTILEDPSFQFNGRTAGDLKDRFRTCCPEELRLSTAEEQLLSGESSTTAAPSEGSARPKVGLHLEDILLPTGDDVAVDNNEGTSPSAAPDSDTAPKRRKPRAHRKKLEDLAELGIHGPFEKSHRRRRRPFNKQDDEEILDGLNQYGPSWTRIQRDPKYNLSSRQPTDLRDRVRNKYPDIYSNIEKANVYKEPTRGKADILEPSVNLAADNPRNSAVLASLEPQLNRTGSREDMSRHATGLAAYESTESLPALADLFDMTEHHAMSFLSSAPEMDVSHLLLEDSHNITIERRQGSKKHQKRLSAPSHWLLDKLSGVYAPRPSAGPHKLRDCMPLIVFIRNRLKYALNYRETKAIMMQRLVKVDGKVRTDITYPAGFMDVITIEKTGENFRLVYDTKGRFTVHRIQDEEAKYKLGKVKRVQLGRGGVPFLVTHDARTIRYPDPLVKVNDTVKIDLETGKITDFIKFDTGSIAMVTGGRNMGRVGVITHRERHDGGFGIVHLKDAIDNTFTTRETNVFVIGSEKPWISLPKGKGVKLTIAEERDRKRATTIAGH
ncbi:40S ribosomal protein S4 [Staphylotrichum tortipilum]|uniref:40S ribosomal protein S4 n=1 Tax=Staphylotrichum tortipilum TaxID=2831512 RepID=A0AAN6MVB0_9PEZI|nr:40S ribosomal protein S4 [Staphylotrichum longicolle]